MQKNKNKNKNNLTPSHKGNKLKTQEAYTARLMYVQSTPSNQVQKIWKKLNKLKKSCNHK